MAYSAHHPSPPIFPPDLSEFMLDVPKRRRRFDWFLFAVLVGTVLAFGVFAFANPMF
jgi:hypothetical protein